MYYLINKLAESIDNVLGWSIGPDVVCTKVHHDHIWLCGSEPANKLVLVCDVNCEKPTLILMSAMFGMGEKLPKLTCPSFSPSYWKPQP